MRWFSLFLVWCCSFELTMTLSSPSTVIVVWRGVFFFTLLNITFNTPPHPPAHTHTLFCKVSHNHNFCFCLSKFLIILAPSPTFKFTSNATPMRSLALASGDLTYSFALYNTVGMLNSIICLTYWTVWFVFRDFKLNSVTV